MTTITSNRIGVPIFFVSSVVAAIALFLTSCKTSETTVDQTPFAHQENVFAAVDNWYVDEVWSSKAAAEGGEAVARHNTGVWLSSILDIEEIQPGEVPGIPNVEEGGVPANGMGLREHLEAAEAQDNALLQVVLYSLPGRGCASRLSFGELPAHESGFMVYQEHYIDRVAGILAEFPHIPVAVIVEPNSLLNLLKYQFYEPCMEVNNEYSFGYTNGVRYAINALSQFENVHIYLDIEASNKFGWDEDVGLTTLFMHGVLNGFDQELADRAQAIGIEVESSERANGFYEDIGARFIEPPTPDYGDTSAPGYAAIDGFISNVGEYVPLDEPYMGDPRLLEGDAPLRSAYFYDWNPRFDEWTYSHDWLQALQRLNGVDTVHLGMLIDTSRNGWGQGHKRIQDGSDVIQAPDLVDDYRIDRRAHRQNWCNQYGGFGERPQSSPEKPWIDAYVWTTPPGISDGLADWSSLSTFPYNISRRLVFPMCDPDDLSTPGQASAATADMNLGTSAIPDAPWVGEWFSEGFQVLTENAWPPVCEGYNDQCDPD